MSYQRIKNLQYSNIINVKSACKYIQYISKITRRCTLSCICHTIDLPFRR